MLFSHKNVMNNNEREIETEASILIAKKFIENKKLKLSKETFFSERKKYSTIRLILQDSTYIKTIGNGKGTGRQAYASALFELIEDFLYNTNAMETSLKYSTEISKKCKKLLYEYPIKELEKQTPSFELEMLKFKKLNEEDRFILYPSFLFDVNSRESLPNNLIHLTKYASNSGSAVGTTFNESLLHAINESIERDALSIHLGKTFFSTKHNMTLLNLENISSDFKEMINEVETTINGKIRIIEVTTEFNIPTYFVICKTMEHILPFKGSGTSLNNAYALERAILECLQHYHLHDNDDEIFNQLIVEKLQHFKNYKNSIMCNHDISISTKTFRKDQNSKNSVDEILKIVINRIESKGFKVYFNSLYESDNIYYTKVIIPGFDNFQMINNGLVLVPGDRVINSIRGGDINDKDS